MASSAARMSAAASAGAVISADVRGHADGRRQRVRVGVLGNAAADSFASAMAAD